MLRNSPDLIAITILVVVLALASHRGTVGPPRMMTIQIVEPAVPHSPPHVWNP